MDVNNDRMQDIYYFFPQHLLLRGKLHKQITDHWKLFEFYFTTYSNTWIISLSFFINVFVPSFLSALSDRIGIVMESIEINVFLRHKWKIVLFSSLQFRNKIHHLELGTENKIYSSLSSNCGLPRDLDKQTCLYSGLFFIVRKKH